MLQRGAVVPPHNSQQIFDIDLKVKISPITFDMILQFWTQFSYTIPPTEITRSTDKIHHVYGDGDDWSVVQLEPSMHYQVYEAAVYYEDEILKLNAIGNIALCFQSPYKDCNLNEAVKFVYYSAERRGPG